MEFGNRMCQIPLWAVGTGLRLSMTCPPFRRSCPQKTSGGTMLSSYDTDTTSVMAHYMSTIYWDLCIGVQSPPGDLTPFHRYFNHCDLTCHKTVHCESSLAQPCAWVCSSPCPGQSMLHPDHLICNMFKQCWHFKDYFNLYTVHQFGLKATQTKQGYRTM